MAGGRELLAGMFRRRGRRLSSLAEKLFQVLKIKYDDGPVTFQREEACGRVD
jgi:hypothetical protein